MHSPHLRPRCRKSKVWICSSGDQGYIVAGMEHSSSDRRVAVALSGGTDSAAVAVLYRHMDPPPLLLTARLHAGKPGLEQLRRAERVAAALGLPWEAVCARRPFHERVVKPFAASYAAGRTPSPCVGCNVTIKFGLLLDAARAKGCSFLATGHYARIETRGRYSLLLKGEERERDQSYFLHRLGQEQLAALRFPLGALNRRRAEELVRGAGLPFCPSESSQDLCFVHREGYAELVERHFPDCARPGLIVDENDRLLGRHRGLHRFTIGQRRGLRVAAGQRLYVCALDAKNNRVIIGPRRSLAAARCRVIEPHWIAGFPPADRIHCRVRLRYRHQAAPAEVRVAGDCAEVEFEQPQFAVTPGQAAVFYDGDEVLGGGWIA